MPDYKQVGENCQAHWHADNRHRPATARRCGRAQRRLRAFAATAPGPLDFAAALRRQKEMGVNAMLVGKGLVVARPEERLARVRELVKAGRR